MTVRELVTLTSRLPAGARIFEDWSQDQHLLAFQLDLLNTMVWQNYLIGMALGLKKKDFNKPPKPMARPSDLRKKAEPTDFSTKEDYDSMMAKLHLA